MHYVNKSTFQVYFRGWYLIIIGLAFYRKKDSVILRLTLQVVLSMTISFSCRKLGLFLLIITQCGVMI